MNVEKLKEEVKKVLPSVDAVIGYRGGFDALHAEPCFVEKVEQVEGMILNPLCVQNLATYLPSEKRRVAVVVKGCDSRSVVQLLQEGLISRERVVVIGVPCDGVLSLGKVMAAIHHDRVFSAAFQGETLVIEGAAGEHRVSLRDVAADKCLACQYPTPRLFDVLAGEPVEAQGAPEAVYDDVRALEEMSLPERKAYLEKELDRCIRCYACRNACPLCVCKESCIAETREPHWMSQKATLTEKVMFHMIHALHLAGRCTECGECERACPMGIRVGLLKKKINRDMRDLFGYVAGMEPEDKPPLFTFKPDEDRIEEHKLP